jgi:RimJ/RimL family protein N-acetyltransferase
MDANVLTEQRLNADTALLTNRTVVRRFREQDGDAFHQLVQANHSRLADHFPNLHEAIHSSMQAELYVRKLLAEWLELRGFHFAIWEKEQANIIGFIQLTKINWHVPKGEVRFFIDREYENQGLMTEALQKMVLFAFNQLALEKISARPAMDNYASQRLVRKVGFQREGDLRADHRRPAGDLVDVMLFGLARSTFE